MSERAGIAHIVMLILLVTVAGATVAAEPRDLTDDRCVVARLGVGDTAETLTSADVDAVRALLEPAPSRSAAGRLLVDAAIAWRLAPDRTTDAPSSRDRLGAYRKLVREVWSEVGPDDGPRRLRQRLAEGRSRIAITLGPCFEPRPAPADARSE